MWMDGWMTVKQMDGQIDGFLTKADLCGLIHHGHLDGASIREDEGKVLGVGEQKLFLPDSPEAYGVHQGHLHPVTPPQGLSLGLA